MAGESPQLKDEFDRYRGIFDPRDRRLLAGVLDEELSERALEHKRRQLRKRMKHALRDLAYLRVMSTEELGDLVAESTPGIDTDRRQAWENEDRKRLPNEANSGDLMGESLLSLLWLLGDLYPRELFERELERYVARRAAIDHFVTTGKFGQFEAAVSTERTDELSIAELEELTGSQTAAVDRQRLPPGAADVLELAAETYQSSRSRQ